MPILEVEKVNIIRQKWKQDKTRLVAKGYFGEDVKITVTIESEFPHDIERLIPLVPAERRNIRFEQLDRTLDEFMGPEDKEAFEKYSFESQQNVEALTPEQAEERKQLGRRQKAAQMAEVTS